MDPQQCALIAKASAPMSRPQVRPLGDGWLTIAEIRAASTLDPPLGVDAAKRRMHALVAEGLAERVEVSRAQGGRMVFYRLKGVE